MPRPDCPFCSIARGAGRAAVVFRGGGVTAFMDWRPIHPGHVLVVPDAHEPDFEELPADVAAAVMAVARALAKAIKSAYAPKKIGLAGAGFDVPHAHVHVIPLHDYHDLTSRRLIEGTLGRATVPELDASTRRIREELARLGGVRGPLQS